MVSFPNYLKLTNLLPKVSRHDDDFQAIPWIIWIVSNNCDKILFTSSDLMSLRL